MSDLHSFKSRLQLVASGENDVRTATGFSVKLGTDRYICWELILSPPICQHRVECRLNRSPRAPGRRLHRCQGFLASPIAQPIVNPSFHRLNSSTSYFDEL